MTTDDVLAELVDTLDRAAGLARQMADTLRAAPVDMLTPDPLAAFRTASGAVAYVTTWADGVKVGDWVQRCHGDPDWHHVTDVEMFTAAGGRRLRRVTYDGTAHDWWVADAIRIARPVDDVIAAQMHKAEAG